MAKSHRWQKTALAAAAAAVLGLWGTHASALSLGRIAVLSALGEPLRAEIDIPDINAEEAASLKASVASPEAFRAAGMDYNASMSGLQITLQKRPDGRSFLRVSSDRAINDPYVDLILEASWSSGRIVRDYTMLFDPPNLRQPQAVTATVPQVSSAPSRVAPTPTPRAATPSPAPASDAGRAAAPRPAARPAPEASPKAATTSPAKQLTVKTGDTASKLVAANRPAGVSLDQMLVAMLRANPDAFIGGNINRLRSGAVVDLPGAEDAQATSADEARQIVLAQSKDFNEFRRKLAGNAPVSQVASADRRASGKVEAQVEDKKSAAATPDKLTLSKGAVQAKGGEEKIAQERSAKEAASRAEELSKNIAELSKLSAAAAPAPAPAASAPQAAAPTPAASEPAAAASAALPAVTVSAPAIEASAPAPAPVASAPVKRPAAAVPMPVEEPSLLNELLDNPLVPAAAAGLIALLAGLGVYRVRQRKQAAQMDSSFLESRLQPDSFFGASGGQRVDTHDSGANGSSMVYSPSQLEAADDVDPVAEADVYLAYGRDLQAEEILKEALRVHPDRVAIHLKLLEIYAKRRDVRNFESSAADAHRLTGGEGADWNRVCELGLSIDPSNTFFQPGGQPASASGASAAVSEPVASAPQASPQVAVPATEPAASAVDLDLDLDFSLDDEPAATPAATATPAAAPAPESTAPDLDLNFELPTASIQGADNSLDFEPPSLPEPSSRLDSPAATSGSAPTAAADTGALEFDLGSLSLDLGEATTEQTGASDDPLATKLALAEEFSAIGDADGARALIEEIIAEATGDMKTKAQEALSKLN
ncbi:MAG: FimV/HubP family polar landmark protein [Hylemonella sp.]|nr:FimV/HubP family polar landmark protein [Hylemonella sp.]MDP1938277.1 FimV/HubP family polar landmark protein [Hylemonella sp.]